MGRLPSMVLLAMLSIGDLGRGQRLEVRPATTGEASDRGATNDPGHHQRAGGLAAHRGGLQRPAIQA